MSDRRWPEPADADVRECSVPGDGIQQSRGLAATSGVSLERQSTGCVTLAAYVMLLVSLDAGKQLSGYALQHYNGGVYPLAPTLIIGLAEIVKIGSIASYLAYDRSLRDVSLSLKFAIPAALYACTNNVHLIAFHYTTPAVWNILMQTRIIITALAYRTLFNMRLGAVQWLALLLLTFAICFAQPMDGGSIIANSSLVGSSIVGSSIVGSNATGSLGGDGSSNFGVKPQAVVLALASSVLSVVAATFMEYTFKNDRRPFMDQQLQLSTYAAVVSLAFYTFEAKSGSSTSDVFSFWRVSSTSAATGIVLSSLLAACVALGAASGVATGLVIAKLDNVVKIYSQALCGVINAIVCTVAFPNNFRPDWKYVTSLALVVASIFLYEKGSDYLASSYWTTLRCAVSNVLRRYRTDRKQSLPSTHEHK